MWHITGYRRSFDDEPLALLATAETQTQISLLQPGHIHITRSARAFCRRIPRVKIFRSPFQCARACNRAAAGGLQLSWAMIKRTLARTNSLSGCSFYITTAE